jgi:hypothetical protein
MVRPYGAPRVPGDPQDDDGDGEPDERVADPKAGRND